MNAVKIADAAIRQWEYKTPAMRDMTIAILRTALALPEFTANDLPIHGEAEHGGAGIAGTVILQLRKQGILAPVGIFDGPTFIPRTRKNPGGNKINIWRLANPSLARTLLDRHAPSTQKTTQLTLL